MRPIPWDEVQHLLAILPDGDTPALAAAIGALRQAQPAIRTTLLTTTRGARAAKLLRWDGDLLECDEDVDPIAVGGDEGMWGERAQGVVERLRGGGYDAAIVLAGPDQSPHVWGYVAYLAGIDHRFDASGEAGAAALSHGSRPAEPGGGMHHLGLLEAAGLPVATRRDDPAPAVRERIAAE